MMFGGTVELLIAAAIWLFLTAGCLMYYVWILENLWDQSWTYAWLALSLILLMPWVFLITWMAIWGYADPSTRTLTEVIIGSSIFVALCFHLGWMFPVRLGRWIGRGSRKTQ
jgi:hypothetical protein